MYIHPTIDEGIENQKNRSDIIILLRRKGISNANS